MIIRNLQINSFHWILNDSKGKGEFSILIRNFFPVINSIKYAFQPKGFLLGIFYGTVLLLYYPLKGSSSRTKERLGKRQKTRETKEKAPHNTIKSMASNR